MKERSVSRRSRRRRRFFLVKTFSGISATLWATTTAVTEASSGGRIREARSGRLEMRRASYLVGDLGGVLGVGRGECEQHGGENERLAEHGVFGVSCVRTARSTNERVVRDRVEEGQVLWRGISVFLSSCPFGSANLGRGVGGAPSAPHSRSRATTTKGMSAGAFLPSMVV